MPMVEKMLITGGARLVGDVQVSGGKNTSVAIIPAALLADSPSTIENLPDIEDVHVLIEILRHLGAQVDFAGGCLTVDPRGVHRSDVPPALARRMRASYYFMGALMSRMGEAQVPLPGGCYLGPRPIDQHVKAFRLLGATVRQRADVVTLQAPQTARGADILFDMVTVGATINAMLAAVRLPGSTTLINAAKEPHIVDLANFLNSMGARVRGAGTDTIRIRGVQSLRGTHYAVIPDQIETGTMMIAAAATHGDVTIHGCIPTHMEAVTAKLLEMGAHVDTYDDRIRVRSHGTHRAVNIKTQVYPGFPTDLQQPMAVLLTTASGTSRVNETIFESRFRYLEEIARMGASLRVDDRIATIDGVMELLGAPVYTTDLRAGAALVVAGLMAQGTTEIGNTHYIDRGYEQLERKLCHLGANIRRIIVEDQSPYVEEPSLYA